MSVVAPLGAEIRRLRKAKGLSQEKLGGLVGLTQGQVCLCERGERGWPAGSLARIAKVLGIPHVESPPSSMSEPGEGSMGFGKAHGWEDE